MKKRLLFNGALFFVALSLLGLVLLELQPKDDPLRLTATEPEQVQRVVIERPGGDMIRLAREFEHWRLQEPRELPASSHHVHSILQLATARSQARYDAADMDLSELGLAEPRLRVRLDGQTFVFGAREPLSQRRYVLFDDQVFLILDAQSNLALGPWWNFIDRELLGFTDEIATVEVAGEPLPDAAAKALVERWRQVSARIVTPTEPIDSARDTHEQIVTPTKRAAEGGLSVVMRTVGGGEMRWYMLDGDPPSLLREDLDLLYRLDKQTFAALEQLLN